MTDKRIDEIRARFGKYRQLGVPEIELLFSEHDRLTKEVERLRAETDVLSPLAAPVYGHD